VLGIDGKAPLASHTANHWIGWAGDPIAGLDVVVKRKILSPSRDHNSIIQLVGSPFTDCVISAFTLVHLTPILKAPQLKPYDCQ
jgi:hypothetical protein